MIDKYFDFIMRPVSLVFRLFDLQFAKTHELLIVLIWGVVVVPLLVVGTIGYVFWRFV